MPTPEEIAAQEAPAKAKAEADAKAAAAAEGDDEAAKKAEAAEAKKAEERAKRAGDVKYLERLERERNDSQAGLRKAQEALDAAEARLKAIDKAKAEEAGDFKKLAADAEENLQKANKKFEAELKARDARFIGAELRAFAAEAGMRTPEDARLFVEMDKLALTEDGVTGVAEAIEALKAEKPYLFKVEKSDDSAARRRPLTPRPDNSDAKAKDAKDMTPEELASAGKIFGWNKA